MTLLRMHARQIGELFEEKNKAQERRRAQATQTETRRRRKINVKENNRHERADLFDSGGLAITIYLCSVLIELVVVSRGGAAIIV